MKTDFGTIEELVPQRELETLAKRVFEATRSRKTLTAFRRRIVHSYSLFMQLRQDFRREEMYGAETIYSVDFSELFPYLHPYGEQGNLRGVKPYEAFLAHILFERTRTRMVLPPAALAEFLDHIRYLSQRSRRNPEGLVDEVKGFQQSGLADTAARAVSNAATDRSALRRLFAEVQDKWPRLVQSVVASSTDAQSAETARRIKFLCEERLSVVPSVIRTSEIDLDDEAFHRALEFLSARRPLRPLANYRDAVNFAFTSHIDKLSFRTSWSRVPRPYLVLLTRGWPLATLGSLAFPFDPIRDEGDLARAGLLRDMSYAVLRTLLEVTIPDIAQRVETAILIVQEQSLLNRLVDRIETEQSRKHQVQADPLTNLKEFGASLLEHHSLRKYRTNGAELFLQACDTLGVASLVGELPHPQANSETDRELIQKLLNVSEQNISPETIDLQHTLTAAKDWAERQLDQYVKAGVSFYSVRTTEYIEEFTVTVDKEAADENVFVLRPRGGTSVLSRFQLRPHAYAVFCDTLPGRLGWFCRLAKYLITVASSHDAPRQMRSSPKLFEGITVGTVSGDIFEKPLTEDLAILDDADSLWSETSRHTGSLPRFVRISTPYMDLFYDFLAPKIKSGTASIISHVALPDVLAYFIIRSSTTLMRLEPLQFALSDFLADKYPKYEVRVDVPDM